MIGPDDWPAYCALCGRGMQPSYSELCPPCQDKQYEENVEEDDG